MSLISVLQSLNGAQFLNATCVIAPSTISLVPSAFLVLTVIFPELKYMHQNNYKDFILMVLLKILLGHLLSNYLLVHCE